MRQQWTAERVNAFWVGLMRTWSRWAEPLVLGQARDRRPVAPARIQGLLAITGANWLTFIRNHCDVIAAADFFTVPTITFGVMYVFFVNHHGRRALLHFNVTAHPIADWIIR